MTPKKLRTAILTLQAQFLGSRQALASGDIEALHSLRVTLRQLCSLLKPLAALPTCSALYASARELASHSSPLRDEEVLCAELTRIAPALAARRQQALDAAYLSFRQSPALDSCQQALADFPGSASLPDKTVLGAAVGSTLGRWQRQLQHALEEQAALEANSADQPASEAADLNKHRLRLLIKRLRYTLTLWQKPTPEASSLIQALRQAQDSLGDWHDRGVWLARSQQEAELLPFAPVWESEMQAHAAWADYQVGQLQKPLKQWRKKWEK